MNIDELLRTAAQNLGQEVDYLEADQADERLLVSCRRAATVDGYRRLDDLDVAMEAESAWYELGDILDKQGDRRRAVYWFRKAAEVGYGDASVRLARLLELLGNRDEAAAWHEYARSIGLIDEITSDGPARFDWPVSPSADFVEIVKDIAGQPLWPVVRRVSGSTRENRHRHAEDDTTRLCLAGGLYQLNEAFKYPLLGGVANDHSDLEDGVDCQVQAMLTYEQVVRVVNNNVPQRRWITPDTLKTQWPRRSDFLADMLSYALYRRHWTLRIVKKPDVLKRLTTADNFVGAVCEVAYENLYEASKDHLFKLYIVAEAYADSNQVIEKALMETYDHICQQWQTVYSKVLEARGMRLRPDIDLEKLTWTLAIIDRGIAGVMRSNPSVDVLGSGPSDCWMGQIICTLISGIIDPGDHATSADVANALANRQQPKGSIPVA